MPDYVWAIILVAAVIVTAVVTALVVKNYLEKSAASTIGSAEDKAREIIDDALKTA